jgi:hypothetical protein
MGRYSEKRGRMPLSTPRCAVVAIALFVAGLVATPPPALAQSPASTIDTSRGLSIQYADGELTTTPLRRSGGMWTPSFPRIPGAETSRNGVPLTTLDVRHAIDGGSVVVTVSLSYGGPGRNLVTVGTVRLSSDEPAIVDGLRAYGVEPITLSLVPIEKAVAYAPEVVSVSGQLSARAVALGPNVSAYRVFVTNRSPAALMWVQFKAFRANRVEIIGRPRGKRNLPLVLPGAEYSFDITASTGRGSSDSSDTWQPLDRIELTSVMWQDGVVEGEPGPAQAQQRVDAAHAAAVRGLLRILRAARADSLAGVRQEIAQAMTFDLETRRAGEAVVEDLDAIDRTNRSRDGQAFAPWLAGTIVEYEQWLARISPGEKRQDPAPASDPHQ